MRTICKQSVLAVSVAAGLGFSGVASATNGMSMEGYGARAGAMGGAGMAYDAGNSNVMNNPAAFGLRKDGTVFGAGITVLGPDVESTGPASFGSPSTESDGTSYLMPSISLMQTKGRFTYGAAILAQGGMGTEYGKAGMGDLFAGGMSAMGQQVPLSGREIRSEVGFGRLMAPLAYRVNDKLSVAAQLDLIWVGMDIQMDIDGATFASMMPGRSQKLGSASGSMVDTFGGAMQQGMVQDINWGRFDFSNDSDFTGEAFGFGFGGKLGVHYRVNDKLMIGASYHTESDIDDPDTQDATVSFNVDAANPSNPSQSAPTTVDVKGEIEVIDFQWPAQFGLGAAYEVNDRFMLAGDLKVIQWSNVLEDFTMKFTADSDQSGAAAQFGLGGKDLTASLKQEWDDQTVISLGGQFKATDKLTLRAGVNLADNPVPDEYLNALFPAIIENHVTAGLGYAFNPKNKIGLAMAYAPEVDATNDMGVTSSHSQLTWRANYVHRF